MDRFPLPASYPIARDLGPIRDQPELQTIHSFGEAQRWAHRFRAKQMASTLFIYSSAAQPSASARSERDFRRAHAITDATPRVSLNEQLFEQNLYENGKLDGNESTSS